MPVSAEISKTAPDTDIADDIIWGVSGENGIAAFLNIEVSRARWLIDSGHIRVRKFGHRTIVASKTELRQDFGARSP